MDLFKTGDWAYVTGGFQKITDTMAGKLDGKVMNGAGVAKIKEEVCRIIALENISFFVDRHTCYIVGDNVILFK